MHLQALLILVFSLVFSQFATAGTAHNFRLEIPTLTSTATIDGKFDESVWQQAALTHLRYETRPAENQPVPVKTEIRMYATETSLFVAFKAFDPNVSNIRANLSDRDNAWSDDLVGIKLDTFNQSKLAYQFFINPLGIQNDSIENELTGQESDAWDGIWYSAGQITHDGYQVEIELPLRILSFDDSLSQQHWGIELIRFYPREERQRFSTHKIDRDNTCQLCQLGVLSGLRGAKQGQGVQITPALVVTHNRQRELPQNQGWNNETNIEPGADIRWSLTPSTLLNATINPDFSQVEADAGQLDVNSTFALFFPEKRSFFLDNKDYFDTQINLLHTRNIVAPDYGVKLTGKVGDHTFAGLVAQDTTTNFLIPGNLSSDIAKIDETSQNLATRYRADFGRSLSLGALFTAKSSQNQYHNYLASFDGKYQLTDQDTFKVQAAFSDTEYPEDLYQDFCNGDCKPPTETCSLLQLSAGECLYNERVLRTKDKGTFRDHLYRIKYNHNSRNYYAFTQFESIGEDFRADLGFIERVDFKKFVAGGGYIAYPDHAWVSKIKTGGDWDISHNQAGELLEQEVEAFIEFTGTQMQSFLAMGAVNRERVGRRIDPSSLAIDNNTTRFDETQFWIYGELSPLQTLNLELDVSYGDDIDFSNNQLGTKFVVNPEVDWKITPSISLNFTHVYRHLDVDEGRLFTANLSDLRLNWQFDKHQFLRISSVYTHIDRNTALYSKPTFTNKQHLGNELLYGYKLNPQSVFYLGYSDGLKRDDRINTLTRNEQTLFMKVSYAWII